MTITMYDAIDVSQIPSTAPAVLGYVDGNWPTAATLRVKFPGKPIVTLTVLGGGDVATGCDIENGDLTPQSGAAWIQRRLVAGAWRPVAYASVSSMTEVLVELAALNVTRRSVRLLSAHYGAGEHICGPSTCKLVGTPMDGTQWTDTAMGRNLDRSLLLSDFFGTAPDGWTFPAPGGLHVVKQTREGYSFAWDAVTGPAGQKPSGYSAYTYNAAGDLVNHQIVTGLTASEYGPTGKGLPAGTYGTDVWANGAPDRPPNSPLTVTLIR